MLGEKSGSKVLYDKLLKVNAHKQFVDIADRAGSDVIKPEHVLCTVPNSYEPGQFTLLSVGLIRYSCGHISGPHELIHVKFGV